MCPSRTNPDIFNEKHPIYHYDHYPGCSIVQAYATSNHQSAYENPNETNGLYIEHICRYLESDQQIGQIFEKAHDGNLFYYLVQWFWILL